VPVVIDIDAVRDGARPPAFLSRSRRSAQRFPRRDRPRVTGAGGDVLFVEATWHARQAGLTLTGQLGDVMKESHRFALSYVRGHTSDLDIEPTAFEDRAFPRPRPRGAIPKDGPSAGVTMVTALTSLLSDRPVKHTVG